jgi:hypothetical protein
MSDPNIRIKRSSVPGKRPEISQVEMGELALNTNDGRLFTRKYNVGIGSTVTLLNVFTENIGGGAYYNDGNIGIGTELPTSKLTVIGDGSFTGIITAAGFDGGPLSGSDGNFDNLNVTGITTSGSLVVNGDISFTGDLIQDGSLFGIGIHSEGNIITGSGTTIIDFVGSAISIITASAGVATVTVERSAFTRTTTAFTATEGQTIFTVNYDPGYIDVYVNGVRLTAAEYTATNGTTVVLSTGATAGDTIDITVYQDEGLYSASKWSPGNGNDIYRLNGNVGIGTDTGNARLDVEGVLGVDTTVTGITTTTATTIDILPIVTYRSARFQVQITQSSDYQSTDLMVIHNGTTANLVEYGSIATNDYLATFSSTISGSNLLLQASMVSAGIATVKVVRYGVTV